MPLAGTIRLKTFLLGVSLLALGGMALVVGLLRARPPRGEPLAEGPAQAQEEAAPVPTTPDPRPSPAPTPPSPRSASEVALSYRGKNIMGPKLKDVTKGAPYKINVYQDEGHASVNRLKIDLDRDDRWDEKWTFDGDTVSRKVAPQDDERYEVKQVWTGSGWE